MPIHGEGRLLDFGCGSGSYLWRMHRQGWKVIGVDPSAAAVDYVRHELGLPALVGSLPHEDLHDGYFDVITMWQSLEHVHWPMEVLRAARRLLAPGGKLIVAVPNIDSLPFRWFGQTWIGLDLPRHLSHFAPSTLTHMLESRRLSPRPGAHDSPQRLAAFVGPSGLPASEGRHPLPALAQRQNRLEPGELVQLSDPPIRLHDGDRGSCTGILSLILLQFHDK